MDLFSLPCRSNLASGSRMGGGGQKPAQVRERQESGAGSAEQGEPLYLEQLSNIILIKYSAQ